MADGAREQMIDAAERLAAEHGLGAMSLREVQAAAGQRNKSAAQYHFGSRSGLIEALVSSRMGPINERRLQMLAALDDQAEPATHRQLVAVLIEPLAERTLGDPHSCWARFLVQGFSDPELSDVVRTSFDGRGYRQIRTRLADSLHHVPPALRMRRVDQATALAVSTLAGAEARRGEPLAPATQVADLLDICTAVLEAPVSATTLAELQAGEARSA